jgi:hypothetical protein
MRSLLVAITVVLLAIAPLSSLTVWAQEGQGWVDEAWDNVARPTLGAPIEMLEELQNELASFGAERQARDVEDIRDRLARETPQTGYVVTFEQTFAHIPEIPEAELMAVYVRSGEFVLDNYGPEPFTVVPGEGRTVSALKFSGDEKEAHYELIEGEAEYVQNENGNECSGVCVIDPRSTTEQTPRVALQLLEGDWVLLPGKELCVWCLLNQYAAKGQTTGILYVYPLMSRGVGPEGFTWIEEWDSRQAARIEATPSAEMIAPDSTSAARNEPVSDILAWAFFNPAPNCRSP